jgi:hypothetical protein
VLETVKAPDSTVTVVGPAATTTVSFSSTAIDLGLFYNYLTDSAGDCEGAGLDGYRGGARRYHHRLLLNSHRLNTVHHLQQYPHLDQPCL